MDSFPKRILIVEDNRSLVDQIRRSFESDAKEYHLEFVHSVHDAIKAIFYNVPDLVLTEQRLPDGTFHDILAMSCDVWPIVVMIPSGKEQSAVDALDAGALDYIVTSSGSVLNLPHVIGHSLREWEILCERKHLTMLLRESEDRYLVLFEHASDGILHLDLTGSILKMNRSFAELHGYGVNKMQAFGLQDISPYLSIDALVSKLKLMPEGEKLNFEIENRHRDGRLIPLNVSVYLISGEGQPYLVVFHRDTRGCKTDSSALQGTRPWEQIFEHVSDLVFVVEEDYSITYSNPSMAKQFGLSNDEIIGLRCHEIIHGTGSPPSFCPHANGSRVRQYPCIEVEKHEMRDRFKKMSIMPLPRSSCTKKSFVHVVQIEPAILHADMIPAVVFA